MFHCYFSVIFSDSEYESQDVEAPPFSSLTGKVNVSVVVWCGCHLLLFRYRPIIQDCMPDSLWFKKKNPEKKSFQKKKSLNELFEHTIN